MIYIIKVSGGSGLTSAIFFKIHQKKLDGGGIAEWIKEISVILIKQAWWNVEGRISVFGVWEFIVKILKFFICLKYPSENIEKICLIKGSFDSELISYSNVTFRKEKWSFSLARYLLSNLTCEWSLYWFRTLLEEIDI